jgi:uncharacterized protein (TIGR02145 family)
MAKYFLSHLIGCSFVIITNLKNHKMMLRILPLLMFPLLGFAQTNSNGEIPFGGITTSEKQALEIKRNATYNLEELKVRWKKAALENCTGAPCVTVTVPGSPTIVNVVAGNAEATVSFTAPSSTGGSAITSYSVTSTPVGGNGTGTGTSIIVTGLSNGTSYTFTVVAANAIGNSVASAASTAVTPLAPNTVPGPPTSVVATAGNAEATVSFTAPSSTGGSAITSYSVTSTPAGGTGSGTGTSIIVTGLANGTSYTFTVVAINVVGSSVASAASTAVTPVSACGSITTVLDGDGNSYQTVGIGTQCWTKTNLKVIKYNDGTVIPDLTASTSNPWATSGARTEYVDAGVTGYVGTFGYLYNWYAVTDSRKICPTGWHVPTNSDWNKLVISIDSGADTTVNVVTQSTTAGTLMKKDDPLWPTNPGTNTSGFSALPGGYRRENGSFSSIRYQAIFWSATEASPVSAWNRNLNDEDENDEHLIVYKGNYTKGSAASVRCLKD